MSLKMLRITDKASIFTAELVALNLALDIIRQSTRKKFITFSDTLSSLMAIYNRHLETGYVQKFISDYSQLVNSGKTIALCWIPSHVGILGNERADVAAKSALSTTISAMKCPSTDLYQSLTDHCQRLWQVEWDGCLSNELHSIKPTLGYVSYSHLGRRDAVTLRRLCIGHTRFSHSYLLNQDDQTRCTYFDCALTVVHMLLECPHYSIVRQRYFSVTILRDLFETVNTHTILDFIKEIGFYNRILLS